LLRVPLCGTIKSMAGRLENRSLDRGLTILNTLAIHGASSLQDLHARTALPKSTIRRILSTLVRRKVVRRSLNDQLYRSNISLPVQSNSRSVPADGVLVDCAVSHMIELTRAIGWSCDLHIFERTRSRVIESTRPLSPFYQYDRQIDLEVPVFASAAGLAVLATWSDAAVLSLVDEIGDHPRWGMSAHALSKRELLNTLRRVRKSGYAVRSNQFRGLSVFANKLHAIARPVLRGDTAVGALVLLWPKGLQSPDEFAANHLKRLIETADAIAADLASMNHGQPAA
jgi:IclR family transcriptional regulator, mhp operon transcriptional activator